MRGPKNHQPALFSYVDIEDRIPVDHPLREIRRIADEALRAIDSTLTSRYSRIGRPSIPPESLIKALLLQILYGIRSEIQLVEQLHYNLLFRWFVDLGIDGKVWTPESFSMNRDRLFSDTVPAAFFDSVLAIAEQRGLVSKEHFSVDGTLLKAWSSQKSFRPKDDEEREKQDPTDFHGEKRSNETHASVTDPDARLFRKSAGDASQLCYMGHILTENRHGIVIDCEVTHAGTKRERDAAETMISRRTQPTRRVTLGADKGYDVNAFIESCRNLNVTPHIAQRNDKRATLLDKRTTGRAGYQISQRKRKRIEEVFGWLKSAGCIRQVRLRSVPYVSGLFDFAMSAYNILRMRNLSVAPT
jgi:transposase